MFFVRGLISGPIFDLFIIFVFKFIALKSAFSSVIYEFSPARGT